MIHLTFNVNKTRIRLGTADSLTTGCVNTVVCSFITDKTYEGMDLIAVFENETTTMHVPLNDASECLAPAQMLTTTLPLYIGLMAIKEDKTITTGRARINVFPGVETEATEGDGYTPTIIESMYTIIKEIKALSDETKSVADDSNAIAKDAKDVADSVREDANNGKFKPVKGVDYLTTAEVNAIKNASKIKVTESYSRYNRTIYVYQNNTLVQSFSCLGRRNKSDTGQSWYITDYSDSSVSGDFTAMLGFRNYGFGNGNLISGIDNDISGRGVIAGGCNNTILSCAEGALIAGKGLTCDNTRTAFALGLGNGNSIQILTDGNIRYYSGSVRITISPEKMREVFGYEA